MQSVTQAKKVIWTFILRSQSDFIAINWKKKNNKKKDYLSELEINYSIFITGNVNHFKQAKVLKVIQTITKKINKLTNNYTKKYKIKKPNLYLSFNLIKCQQNKNKSKIMIRK